MGPVGPKRTDDGPACRVCGCTQNNPCIVKDAEGYSKTHKRPVDMRYGCSWAPTGELDEPRALCSACAGTPADIINTFGRIRNLLAHHYGKNIGARVIAITSAAELRFRARSRYDSGDTISPAEAVAIGAFH